jgi:ATP/maltotriose-dependent transcriptional regulator MalT
VLDLVERITVQTFAPEFGPALDRLQVEHDNVRAALVWADETGADDVGLRLARAMSDFWMVRGHFGEGRRWLEHFLNRAAPVPSVTRAGALTSIGWLTNLQGDLAASEPFLLGAVDVARAAGAGWLEAVALYGLSATDLKRGELARAAERAEATLNRFTELEGTAAASPHWTSLAAAHRAEIAIAQDDTDTAERLLAEALARQQSLGFTWGMSATLRILGDLARNQGALERALLYYKESVELGREDGDLRLLTEALVGLASIAAHAGQTSRAARLYGAASAHRLRLGMAVEGWDPSGYERDIRAARAGLSPESFAAAWAAGEAFSMASFIAEALSVSVPMTAPHPLAGKAFGLTTREREVLHLLTGGLSDREIADALSISPRTAGYHVSNLLAKLGVDSRTGAVAIALRQGLA